MLLLDDLILKGNGVLLQGQHAEDRGGQMRALSPSEMLDKFNMSQVGGEQGALMESPFHIDPATGESLQGKPGYDCRNIYQALVEGMYHHLVRKLGPLDPEGTKRTLRRYVNQAAEEFNQSKLKANPKTRDLYPHARRLGRYQPGTASVFTNLDSGALHPEIEKSLHVYTPEYQKIGNFGSHIGPEQIRLKNAKGQFGTLNHSGQDHGKFGHMSEGGFFGAIMQYLSYVTSHWKVEPPHTMSTGNIKPEEFVIHTDHNGNRTNFWKYWHANQDPNEGNNPVPDAHKKHRSISLRSGLGSLWEGFFQPALHPRELTPERRGYAQEILTRGGQVPGGMIRSQDVDNFSRSILMQLLEDSASGHNALRSATKAFHWYNEMRRAVGLPKWNREPVGREENYLPRDMPSQQRALLQKFNTNVRHMGLGKYMNKVTEQGNSHHASNKALREGLLLSYMLEDPEMRKRATDKLSRMPNADGNGLQEGQRLKQLFMRVHGDEPFFSSEHYDWLEPSGVDPVGEAAPRADTGQWPRERAGFLPRPRLPRAMTQVVPPVQAGRDQYREAVESPPPQRVSRPQEDSDVGPENMPMLRWSDDNLYDLMESLQSADARLDDMVMKSLPSPRRHELSDERDLTILCKHYNLTELDIHYIENSVGDWDEVAQRLKVDPHIVKAVKVALRW